MDAFSGLILVVAGFALGFGAMWAYCRFVLDRKQPTR
jgi:SNF family Na+-dependent transporter